MTGRSLAAILAAALALAPFSFVHAQSSKSKTVEPAPKAKAPPLKPFDVNSASEDDLVLAGVARAAAKQIIAARPFKNKSELVSRKLLTKDQYEKIKDTLVAKQPPNEPAKAPGKMPAK